MEKIEQNQVVLREDIDLVKGNIDGMKDKINQLTRAITNMKVREVEADKRNTISISTPPPVDGNPLQGFISDIQGAEANITSPKINSLHPKGSIPIFVQSGASRPVQILVSHDNYVDLSQQYEDKDHMGMVQESKPDTHLTAIIGEPRVNEKYKIMEKRLKVSMSSESML